MDAKIYYVRQMRKRKMIFLSLHINNFTMIDTSQLKTGAILVVPTRPIGIFNHFGILYYDKGVGYIAHNSFLSGKIITTPLDEFLATRNVLEVIPSDGRLDDAWIINKIKQLNDAGVEYDFWGTNCEWFVKEICGCQIGRIDQRAEFGILLIALGVVMVVSLLILNCLK